MNEFSEIKHSKFQEFIPMSDAQKALFIAEQQPDGSIKFVSAGMLFESSNPARITTNVAEHVKEEADMIPQNSKSVLTWTVTVLPILAAIVGATTWINSTIDSKARDNRLELKQDLQQTKQDLSMRVDKLEDKVDTGFRETSNQLNEIKVLLVKNDKSKD
ncbi:hypothetical protein RZP54_04880 [Raoultella ornithinolytica]|jgi:hypothetical protein|uniref:hypothetical protein n=1 Tax=Raoultella TaxID=160674 RepID=UPI001951D8CC|nr:hypothetical protein [Raoultella ornithinolytica]HDT2442410.1 hypothetical protein [Klebsiella pneumoniae subsp. pneumoniae]ELS0896021.1 hypothetical protein [Raoultella ornithinolytica]ELS1887100.1 hypothetical protein [Raoultella ornithinolytica]MBM6478463.1 hypothetical protein [Raoultella ornithinolytica]MCF6684204.1 hypothetical protein [Raoultella ornithinolytica]